MANLVRIHNTDVIPLESNGVRVITLDMIDALHERPVGTAGRTFRKHQCRLNEGRHYFRRTASEAQELGITAPNGLVLLTEAGYLLLVKTFRDDLAWEVQEQLIEAYFRVHHGAFPKIHDHRTEIAIQTLVRLDEAEHHLALMEQADRERQAEMHATRALAQTALDTQHYLTIREYVFINRLEHQMPPSTQTAYGRWLAGYCLERGIPVRRIQVADRQYDSENGYHTGTMDGTLADWLLRRQGQANLHLITTEGD